MSSTATCVPPVVKTINGRAIRLEKGDLTALPVDAFVFYAREDLKLSSGFGTAIESRGGGSIKKELEGIGPIGIGQAVITGAGKMKAKNIIHACGPKFQESDTEPKLRACIQSALEVADKAGCKTVAFPPLGTGFYGVPLDLCAKVMLEVIQRFFERQSSLQEVIVCVLDNREFKAFQPKFQAH